MITCYPRTLAAALLLWPAVALAQGANDLALTIEQNLASIGFRIELRPKQAEQDLEAQGRQLELLATEAPDHPALPELEQTYEALQADLAAALAGDAADEATVAGPPVGFDIGMEEVESLQARAEEELIHGNADQASGYLQQAEAQLDSLERRYAAEIPAGHVPLLVAQEKLAVLKDQLAERATR